MIDIQLLRKEPDAVAKRLSTRGFELNVEEFRRLEEQRKKIAAMEAAAPVAAAITSETDNTIAPPATEEFLVGHPHEQPLSSEVTPAEFTSSESTPEPLPIATSGDLNLMPPATGLPVSNSALSPVLESIPHDSAADASEAAASEATQRV